MNWWKVAIVCEVELASPERGMMYMEKKKEESTGPELLHAFRSINLRLLGGKSKSKSFLLFFLGFKVSHFHAGFT